MFLYFSVLPPELIRPQFNYTDGKVVICCQCACVLVVCCGMYNVGCALCLFGFWSKFSKYTRKWELANRSHVNTVKELNGVFKWCKNWFYDKYWKFYFVFFFWSIVWSNIHFPLFAQFSETVCPLHWDLVVDAQ